MAIPEASRVLKAEPQHSVEADMGKPDYGYVEHCGSSERERKRRECERTDIGVEDVVHDATESGIS